MGVFSRLWGRKSASRLALEDMLADGFFTQPAKSGVAVTWKTALQATTALACARVIAEGLAQVPLRVFRSHDGVRTPAEDHPLYGLLGAAPNDWQTSFEFIEQVVMHLVFCGNAFVFVNRGLGRIAELLPYEPQQVTVKRDGYVSSYEVTTDEGRHIRLSASEMWHLRGPSWNGWMGLEGVRLAREAIGLSLATEEHGARLFSNGAVVGGILSTDQVLNDEIRELLEEQHKAFEEFKQANDDRLAAIEKKGFAPADLEEKVARINEDLTRLGKYLAEVAKKANRPGAGADGQDPMAQEHKQALGKFLRKGDDRELAGIQRKAMATYSDPDGGYFLTEDMAQTIERTVSAMSALSGMAQTIAGNAAVYKKPVRTTGVSYAWRGEGESPSTTSTPKFSLLTFEAREVDAFPEVTNESLEDLGFNVEAFLMEEVALAFAEAEAEAFLTGNGVSRPRGLLTYDAVENDAYAWGKLGYVLSGGNGAFAGSNPSDKLIDLIHALKAQYRASGAFLLNDLTLAAIRKFKDGQGNYLWQPGLQAGIAGVLLGYPVRTDDTMPDVASGSLSIAFGDFKRAYLLYRRRGMRIIRDNITNKGFTSFWVTERFGGGVQNFEAVKFMKFSAS